MVQITSGVTILIITNLLILLQQPTLTTSLSALASFRQKGITGTINFSQDSPSSSTLISVSIEGLNQLPNEQYPWHIHQYPFTNGDDSPCSLSSVGGHYDPLRANENLNYSSDCQQNRSLCEIGDISGKFGKLNSSLTSFNISDDHLPFYGQYTILGRSVVLHFSNGSRYVCANIYPNNSEDPVRAYVPLRGGSIFGDISIIQYTNNSTLVYSKLFNTVPVSLNHSWHVHTNHVSGDDVGCTSAAGHYNPHAIDTTGNYSALCSPVTPLQCEVGDLSGKGGTLSFNNNFGQTLYTDTQLPYTPVNDVTIANRSIVIHQRNGGSDRIACGNIVERNIREASAEFNNQKGINGVIKFKQASPFSLTEIDIELYGLNDIVSEYYVYATPPSDSVDVYNKCLSEYTGNIWNPSNSNQDPIGDLSSKYGPLNGDSYMDTFTDSNIPLFGSNSIIGRSIVLHHKNSSRWVCAKVMYDTPTVEATARLNISGIPVEFRFVQPANDPFADTTITIIRYIKESNTTSSTTSSIVSSTTTTLTNSLSLTTAFSTVPPSSNIFQSTGMTSVLSSTAISSAISSEQISSAQSFTSPSFYSSQSQDVFPLTSVLSSTAVSSATSPISTSSYSSQTQDVFNPSPTFEGSGENPFMLRRRRHVDSNEENDRLLIFENEIYDGEDLFDTEFEIERDQHQVRKRETNMIGWSIKRKGLQSLTTDCASLEQFLQPVTNSLSLCSSGNQLACSAGELTEKHGMIAIDSEDGVRMVLTDPYIPLSGPDSAIGNVLLITIDESSQYITISDDNNIEQEAVSCNPLDLMSSSTIATILTTPTKTNDNYGLPLSLPILIAVCVGGLLVLIIAVVIVIIIIVCCAKRRNSYNFESYAKSKSSGVELGLYKKSNPIYGIAAYKVLYDYKPQQQGDLELKEGELLTLIEAPEGGEWWKGTVNGVEGWFPKSYVSYVDVKVEEKKKKEAEMDRVSAVIKAYTITGSRLSTLNVDSTPLVLRSFEEPIKEENETTFKSDNDEYNLPNTPPESGHGTPCPDSHKVVSLVPTGTVFESPPPSNESLQSSESPPPVSITNTRSPSSSSSASPVPIEDMYLARFDLVPETESELKLIAGERVIVIERSDNGWWHGVIGDNHGWVPKTFLQPLNEFTDNHDATYDTSVQNTEQKESDFRPRGMTEFHSGISEEVNVSEYQAVADYVSDTEGDLSFKEGDMVLVYWGNEDGWWYGAAGSCQGWFPGSYIEPVMDESINSPINAQEEKNTCIPSSADISQEYNNVAHEDKLKPTETFGEDSGEVIDEITSTQQEKIYLEEQSSHYAEKNITIGGGTLADEIAAALKKKDNQESGESIENTTTSTLTEAQQESDNRAVDTEQMTIKDRSDSVHKLGSDIISLITTMGSKENLLVPDSVDKSSPKGNTMRHPQRKAPPPPNVARSKSSKVKSKKQATANKVIAPEQSLSCNATIPIAPPPPPLPGSLNVLDKQPVIDKNTEIHVDTASGNKLDKNIGSIENLRTPGSPGSASSTRRKPPSPPSPLVIHKVVSETVSSPSPLVSRNMSKSCSPQSELHSDTKALKQDDQVHNENTNRKHEDKVQLRTASSTAKWQPQIKHRSSGWKPQTNKIRKEQQSAPRREPPKPPASDSSPRIKIQKVKRPTKNIPPPPSVPLPPPPPNKSKTQSHRQGPPPVKKVLSGPPPVKHVLGKHQTVKKVLSSPVPPPTVQQDSNSNEDMTIQETPSKITQQVETTSAPVITHELVKTPQDTIPMNDTTETPNLLNKLNTEMADSNSVQLLVQSDDKLENISELPKPVANLRPAVSPKPKIKPAISPKPRKIPGHLTRAEDIQNSVHNSSVVSDQSNNKPRPTPPERTSSLPNTPNSSPCPSPLPQPRPNHHSVTAEHHTIDRNEIIPSPLSKVLTPSETGATHDTNELDVKARKKSSTLPPRPAPPKTTRTRETTPESSLPRKISEPRVRMKNLMSPMKVLDPRPARRTVQSTEVKEKKSSETINDDKPIPKRRTSQQNDNNNIVTSNNIPPRPPPPIRESSKTQNIEKPMITSIQQQPVPKPRSTNNKDLENEILPSEQQSN